MLRHGGMDKLFDGIRAPSTLGSFLRAFTWGNVRQLEKSARQLLMASRPQTNASTCGMVLVEVLGREMITMNQAVNPG